MAEATQLSFPDDSLRQAFRSVYIQLLQNVESVLAETSDSSILARICDEIDEYQNQISQVSDNVPPSLVNIVLKFSSIYISLMKMNHQSSAQIFVFCIRMSIRLIMNILI